MMVKEEIPKKPRDPKSFNLILRIFVVINP